MVSRGSRVLFDISNVNARVVELAVRIMESRLPQSFDRPSLERVYVKALRSGSWWRAPGEARGVLWAALRSSVNVFKSPRVISALRHAIAWFELYTMRGFIVLSGLSYAIPRGLLRLSLDHLLSRVDYILYLGRHVLATYAYYWHVYKS